MGLCCWLAYLPSWYTIKVLLVINAIVGFLIFFQAWKRTEKIRQIDKERDAMFHSSTRWDWPRWGFWSNLPIAMTILPLRLCFCMLGLFVPGFLVM